MFNIGGGEFIVIAVLALIVLGPSRLPEAARQIGKTMSQLRQVSAGFQKEFQSALDDVDPAIKDAAKKHVVGRIPASSSPLAKGLSTAVAAVSAQGAARAEAAEAAASSTPAAAPKTAPTSTSKKRAAPAKKRAPAKKTAAKATPVKRTTATSTAKKATAQKKKAATKAPATKAAPRKRPSGS